MDLTIEWSVASEWNIASAFSRRDAKLAYENYKNLMQWRNDGSETFIDIGCATGDVIFDVILPKLPKKFEKIKCVDISEEMLEYIRKFRNHPKVTLEKLDISKPLETIDEQFDHCFSFYCFQWLTIADQQIALKNVYNLLKENGDCLLTIPGTNPRHKSFLELSKNTKWSKYMEDVKDMISPYHFIDNPKRMMDKLLALTGFSYFDVQYAEQTFNLNINSFREFLSAINPYLPRIPIDKHDQYMEDLMKIVQTIYPCEKSVVSGEMELKLSHKTLYIYAQK